MNKRPNPFSCRIAGVHSFKLGVCWSSVHENVAVCEKCYVDHDGKVHWGVHEE